MRGASVQVGGRHSLVDRAPHPRDSDKAQRERQGSAGALSIPIREREAGTVAVAHFEKPDDQTQVEAHTRTYDQEGARQSLDRDRSERRGLAYRAGEHRAMHRTALSAAAFVAVAVLPAHATTSSITDAFVAATTPAYEVLRRADALTDAVGASPRLRSFARRDTAEQAAATDELLAWDRAEQRADRAAALTPTIDGLGPLLYPFNSVVFPVPGAWSCRDRRLSSDAGAIKRLERSRFRRAVRGATILDVAAPDRGLHRLYQERRRSRASRAVGPQSAAGASAPRRTRPIEHRPEKCAAVFGRSRGGTISQKRRTELQTGPTL